MTEFIPPDRTLQLGALAAALAKAQAAFPAVLKGKHVKITTKTGGSYEFDYAPLDTILEATRKPLTDNGIAVVQMLDDGSLVTSIIHEGGGIISGRIDLPPHDDIKGLGSAITYLRRYAIQSALGLAAEDDDDGSRATGDAIETRVSADVARGDDGSLIGVVQVGDKQTSDYLIRQTPDGPALGFRLRGDKGGILVEAKGELATQLDTVRDRIVGSRVTVWGTVGDRSFKTDKRTTTYQALAAERISVPILGLLPMESDEEPIDPKRFTDTVSAPMFTEAEQAAIDEVLS
jgi:hypothetical protein